ncbi:2-C-methyl-D-erythritol 4-phosphate cytidylyltransferase [Candidatus Palibaumannia cicadellinicola]|uniref:2-C-methyl-D-erythritol 4-phosphate cytidylyltransferase n=1 Tax=Baumannia cicadellinicola subsp. Homalodisca coagulata TaxID=374463 RepID=ISPD_BAUCH|nr:2-C-methyl-D-erythritol 4-phosphate cytidylyltransferase [Candidatus Baumannia cicadellinicola]Q1LTP8.1 RecName: Full=2-C-methyl-D-erythritol 4-phosphate cytidylyltransferase; AltName: Full=4-diphosphocytidyl-2C-methyl-D-erythritol synthase; AltName: Full=MEP cytidylyltransferase; Short=MCT [Baumannia cicadellinicola str. Hc (Homalodisca coagulata)]ABF14203.1 2-C-methyl-D-erythritol 4-phosphate cytidylyltransferase [Baumannia cicadellinicola str. Hc (Homalodisca coagulata)]MCJ7462351.1 2-C-me
MTCLTRPLPNVVAILPAAGKGRRMQTTFPKQYLTIGNKTLLELTIYTLLRQPCISQIIVAISPDDYWFAQLPIAAEERVMVVTGGSKRVYSVMRALRYVKHVSWVLVHDAVRPCLHQEDLICLLTITAHSTVGGILATPVRDTIKRAGNIANVKTINYTVVRKDLWHALTPQLFMLELLKSCLQRALKEGVTVTDESAALEYCGYQPLLVPGRADNIKVTWPEDLQLASFYLSQLTNTHNK